MIRKAAIQRQCALTLSAGALLLSASTPVIGNDAHLSPSDCDFITTYDSENAYSFVSDFAYMAHFPELVPGCEGCSRPLRKQDSDFEVSVVVHDDSDETREHWNSLRAALRQFVEIVESHTDLSVSFVPSESINSLNDNMILIIFISDDNIEYISRLFQSDLLVVEMMQLTLQPQTNCIVNMIILDDALGESFLIFVDAENSFTPRKVASCVVAKTYNSMGLRNHPQGEGSLFSNERWLGPEAPAPAFRHYGHRDAVMLKLLYRDEFENGQDYDETRAEIEAIIANECPAQ